MAWPDFIAVARSKLGHSEIPTYGVNFDGFITGGDPLATASLALGTDVQNFCDEIKKITRCYIILITHATTLEKDHYNELRVIGDFLRKTCENSIVVTVSPQPPEFYCPSLVSLYHLEEVECNRYIAAHPLGSYVSPEEIESATVYNYTGGSPAAIDSYLKLRQHDDYIDIQRTGLRNCPPGQYYPKQLVEAVNSLGSENPDALDLLLVLSVFPMGESAHAVRYIQPDRRLHGKCAIALEELGLVYQVSLRSETIGMFEPHKLVVVHRLVREYIYEIYLQKNGIISRLEHIQAAICLYFGTEWRKEDYKLKGNLVSGKIRHSNITAGNSRALLLTLVSFAHDDALNDASLIIDALKLVNFYSAQLSSATNFKSVIDLTRDIWDIVILYTHIPAAQEIIQTYMMALRMRHSFELALTVSTLIAKPHSKSFSFRIKTEIAYCQLAVGDSSIAKQLADEVQSECKDSTLMHAKYISLRLSSYKNKPKRLENLAKESRARGVVTLSNFIKSHLLRSIGDAKQRRTMFKAAAEEAQLDGDGLNYARNTIEYCEMTLAEGLALSKSDIAHMEEAYRLNYSQRLTSEFKKASSILWEDSKNKRDLDRLLELFARGSQVFQILKLDNEEERYLTELFIVLQDKTSHKLDARLKYALVRALELERLSFEKISNSLQGVVGDYLTIPPLKEDGAM
ncbi:hypothetical protein [Pseudomonas viridiflava]|uniref:hypothetical protein n=1 Tax=Pseudomonas viridiflava TaxID=33069 RepID=UPI0013CEFD39|nr:hypothetical protein [Pseudomonas viridiflava]